MSDATNDSKYRWLWVSLAMGLGMFMLMGVLYPVIEGHELSSELLIRKAILWLAFGFTMGISQHFWRKRKAGRS